MNFDELRNFLEKNMEMNEIYQPVIIRHLLRNGFTSDRDSIEEELAQTSGKEIGFFRSSATYDICGVLERRGVITSDDSKMKFGKISLKLDGIYSKIDLDELIQICNYRIIDWELKNYKDKKIFLIQIGGFGGKSFDQNSYTHYGWEDTPRDADHGKINEGDFIIFYFTSKAKIKENYKGILKTFCKVTETKSKNQVINFKRLAEFRGLEFDIIKGLKSVLQDRNISFSFNKIGSEGFNIKNISREDFSILYETDKKYKNIFLCSIQSELAFSHFKDTMLKSHTTRDLNVGDEFKKYPELCVWGSKYTEQYKKHWDKIRNGDLILFFKDHYRYAAILLGTERNAKVAEKLWGKDEDKTWELIMYFQPQNIQEIAVEKEKLNELIPGYSPNAYPMNNNPFYGIKSENIIGMMLHED